MITAVDSNILFGHLAGPALDREFADRALAVADFQGAVVTSAVVYAELAGRFSDRTELDSYLESLACTVEAVDAPIAHLAGRYFHEYRRRGGERARILPDFLIAAHAKLNADRILTRDGRFFGGSFPGLTPVTPEEMAKRFI